MKQLESDIQTSINKQLPILTDHFYPVQIDVNLVSFRGKKILRNCRPGVADFFIQGPHDLGFWLEVKRPGGYQRQSQKLFQRDITANGGSYYIVHSLREALECCVDFCGRHGVIDRRLESVLEQWKAA